jgi:transcriptional regulator with XRE-family HTH domain
MSSQDRTTLKRFGKALQAKRKQVGITQERLAELCDLDPTYISLLERGQRNPSLLAIANLARSLRCRVGELVNT